MENYFNYFTEIEDRYLQRRGGGLLLSTLDWSLIETWKDAGIPLQAVLRGIDSAFDKYDQRPKKAKKINSLAYCSQEVLAAAEDMKEAVVGAATDAAQPGARQGFEPEVVGAFLIRNAELLEKTTFPDHIGSSVPAFVSEITNTLRQLADQTKSKKDARLEDLERRMTVLEEKLLAALLTFTSDNEILEVRTQADRDIAPYRSKMSGPQIEQLQRQYINKRLLEKYRLPRLSLFYM